MEQKCSTKMFDSLSKLSKTIANINYSVVPVTILKYKCRSVIVAYAIQLILLYNIVPS